MSAAARIDTARPWGQISLPKSPWPPRRRPERDWVAEGGLLRLGGPCCGVELGLPMGGTPPGSPWALGHRKPPLGGLGGRLDLPAPRLLPAPVPSHPWQESGQTEAPGKSLKLRWPLRRGGRECSEKEPGRLRLQSRLTGRGLASFSGWSWGIRSPGEGSGVGCPFPTVFW